MKIEVISGQLQAAEADTLVVNLFRGVEKPGGGTGAVDRYGGVPPYAETEDYVEKVQALYERYRTALKKPATRKS